MASNDALAALRDSLQQAVQRASAVALAGVSPANPQSSPQVGSSSSVSARPAIPAQQGSVSARPAIPAQQGSSLQAPVVPASFDVQGYANYLRQWHSQAEAFTKDHATKDDDEVTQLCKKFEIQPSVREQLQDVMRVRIDTFEEDMHRLYTDLGRSRNPNGLLITKIQQMRHGTFVGLWEKPDPELDSLAHKFKLDKEAQARLSDLVSRHPPRRRQEYYRELETHMQESSNPSALMMTLLKKIGNGESLGPVKYRSVASGKRKVEPNDSDGRSKGSQHYGHGRERDTRSNAADNDRKRQRSRNDSRGR